MDLKSGDVVLTNDPPNARQLVFDDSDSADRKPRSKTIAELEASAEAKLAGAEVPSPETDDFTEEEEKKALANALSMVFTNSAKANINYTNRDAAP
ncbi:hypothetical protein HDE_02794 [Halotydeus destructor]|nr:hypothetical protein HDE_02794 [Halotydeus destructor]